MTAQVLMTLLVTLGVTVLSIVLVTIVLIAKARNAMNRTFRCPYCGKTFSPSFFGAMGANMNFGDESVLVKCTECGKKERMIPTDIR